MGNRRDLSDMYKGIKSDRGLIRSILPFLRTDKDNERMMAYLDALIKHKAEINKDDDEYEILKTINRFGLTSSMKKLSKLRVSAAKKEAKEQNQFYKHLLDTRKERVRELKKNQSLMSEQIKLAKEEYKELKKAGVSKLELIKAYENIKKLKDIKNQNVDSKLRGYGLSGQEDKMQGLKASIDKAIKENRDEKVIARLQDRLQKAELKHTNILSTGGKKYDFTLRNASGIFTDVAKQALKNPATLLRVFGGAFGAVARAIPFMNPYVAGALMAYGGYKSFIAPMLFGNGTTAGFTQGAAVRGYNLSTGKEEVTTVGNQFDTTGVFDTVADRAKSIKLTAEKALTGESQKQFVAHKTFQMIAEKGQGGQIKSYEMASNITSKFAKEGYNPALAYSVMEQESGVGKAVDKEGKIKRLNKNGTTDYGIYQTNTVRINELIKNNPKYFKGQTAEQVGEKIASDPMYATDIFLMYEKQAGHKTASQVIRAYNPNDVAGTLHKIKTFNSMVSQLNDKDLEIGYTINDKGQYVAFDKESGMVAPTLEKSNRKAITPFDKIAKKHGLVEESGTTVVPPTIKPQPKPSEKPNSAGITENGAPIKIKSEKIIERG